MTRTFRVVNVTTSSSTARGLRVGLFTFSEPGAARVTAGASEEFYEDPGAFLATEGFYRVVQMP